jgi:hypothetical protein
VIATVTELATRVQQDVDTATAQLLLEIAEDLIVAESGVLDPWPPRLKGIQLDAATRAYVNPAGVNHELFETYTRSGIPPGGVYLTDDERQVCRAARTTVGNKSGLVSVRLTTPADLAGYHAPGDPFYGFSGDWP